MRRLLTSVMWIGLSVAVGAQDPLYFPPADRVSVRLIRELSPIDLAPGVHVRTVVGQSVSVSVGDFEPGAAAVLHHHLREQGDVGLTGTFDMTIGTHVEKLGPDMGVIVPANVDHSIANKGSALMTVLEFHTVPRPDLVPPRPAMTFPSSPESVPLPDRTLLVHAFRQVPSEKAERIAGKTCAMTWHRLGRDAKPGEVLATGTELLVYVAHGTIQLETAGAPRRVQADSVIVIPAGQRARFQPVDTDVTLIDFNLERR